MDTSAPALAGFSATPDTASTTTALLAEIEARRCHLCGARRPAFGFGPPLPVRTTLWACGAHAAELERALRTGTVPPGQTP